jgi:hypothetical protein
MTDLLVTRTVFPNCWNVRMSRACFATVLALMVAVVFAAGRAHAQADFDRPGGDYQRIAAPSGDPAACALLCERDRRCRAWSFTYPREGDGTDNVACWLKNTVPPRVKAANTVSGVRGAGVVEHRTGETETSIDRFGGDYRSFGMATDASGDACRARPDFRRGQVTSNLLSSYLLCGLAATRSAVHVHFRRCATSGRASREELT